MGWVLSLLGWAKARAVAIGSVVAASIALLITARRSGQQKERLKQLEEVLKNVRKKDGATEKVDRLPDGDAARRLRDTWSRD